MGRCRIIPEDPAHVVEQFGCRQHHGRITELVEAVEEELSVLVALGGGAGEPISGLLPILLHIPAQEIQLSQCVLGKGISLFGSSGQVPLTLDSDNVIVQHIRKLHGFLVSQGTPTQFAG